jgi:hypothetical protein
MTGQRGHTTKEIAASDAPPRELAYRESDGLEVTLLWNQCEDELVVHVADSRTGTAFAVEAASDRALDVFNHPFSYAASRNAPSTSLLVSA